MFCIASFIVLSILGIFSASNRALAKEALDCVLRRVTFRPCNTGFDEKMKSRILGSVLNRSETAARFINKNFEVLAWIFILLFFAAGVFAIRGVYLFYTTGSCNGLNSAGFCVFDPTGQNNQVSAAEGCSVDPKSESDLTLENVDLSSFPVLNSDAADNIVMIGCYHCEYTRQAYPEMKALVERYPSRFTFAHFPTKEPDDYFSRLAYCVNEIAPDKFWQFNGEMFTGDKEQLDDPGYRNQMLSGLGIDAVQIQTCTDDSKTAEVVARQLEEIKKTKFYGTPTIFINGRAFVGPKPYRVYAIELKGLFYWLR